MKKLKETVWSARSSGKLRSELAAGFLSFLSKYGNSRLVITGHSNFDLDALVCCYAMKSVLPNSVIAIPDKMDAPASAFAEKLGLRVEELGKLKKEEFEGLVVVDCSTPVLLEEAKGWKIKLIIDHHHESEKSLAAEMVLRDENAPSAAEMVAEMLPEVSPGVAFVLAVGVVSDTARFKSARASTFSTLGWLVEKSGKEYSEILGDADPELDIENKLNVLEAFKGMRIHVHGGYVIATSVVPAHESLVSSSLSEFADVCFVGKWKNEVSETRISSRARRHVPIPLNEVMREVGIELNGGGGGHPKAAGCSAKARPGETLDKCIEIFIKKLDEVGK